VILDLRKRCAHPDCVAAGPKARPAFARGLCRRHYWAAWKKGEHVQYPTQVTRTANEHLHLYVDREITKALDQRAEARQGLREAKGSGASRSGVARDLLREALGLEAAP
jgi:hypothetical protein